MDPCKFREPKVIDNALLAKCIKQQIPPGEASRLLELEGMPIEEVDQIRLEYLNLLRIDHLWVLTSLTKLSLNNNLIEKIENLETLVHLVELDLSFNKISKIENLDELHNLEKLSLYENLIETMENMDTLKKLTIFSIGKNRIVDMDNIFYLRQFSKLVSLNMAGNPCADDEDFRTFVAIFLPQLVYYEYRLVREGERELGRELFSEKLKMVEEEEGKIRAVTEKEEKEKADAELHSSSFVEYLNSRHLFDLLFMDDADGQALLKIEDTKETYSEYEEQFVAVCQQIFEIGQQQYAIRSDETNQFFKSLETARKQNQEESIKHMEDFLEHKAHIFYEISQLQEMLNSDEIDYDGYGEQCEKYVAIYDGLLHKTWKVLMKIEMELFEQVDELNQTFEHVMTDMVNVFIEAAQGLFSQIRALEVSFMESMNDTAMKYQTNASLNEDIIVPTILKPLMADKDVLLNALAGSHDMHMQLIDNREDILISRARQWLSTLVVDLDKEEIARNRTKILEINHFLDIQREEFDELTAQAVAVIAPSTVKDEEEED